MMIEFSNDELRDIHRALKTQERVYAEMEYKESERRYRELAARVINAVRHDEGKHHIGERSISSEGIGVEIIDWRGKENIDVKFDNGRVMHQQSYRKFRKRMLYAEPASRKEAES